MSTFQWSQCGTLAVSTGSIGRYADDNTYTWQGSTPGKGQKRDVKNGKVNEDIWVRSLCIGILAMCSICNPSLVSLVPEPAHNSVGTLYNRLLTKHARMQSLLATPVQ